MSSRIHHCFARFGQTWVRDFNTLWHGKNCLLKWYLPKSVMFTVHHLKNSIRACAIYTRSLNQLVVIELLSYKGAVVHRSKGRLSQTFEWLLLVVSSAAFMPQCTATTIVATRHILFFSVFCRHSRGQCCISHFSKKIFEKRNAPYFKIQTVLTGKVVKL